MLVKGQLAKAFSITKVFGSVNTSRTKTNSPKKCFLVFKRNIHKMLVVPLTKINFTVVNVVFLFFYS